jgi:hypothetical protein
LRNGGCNSSEIFINFAALFLVRVAVNPATAAKPPSRWAQAVSDSRLETDRKRILKIQYILVILQKNKMNVYESISRWLYGG